MTDESSKGGTLKLNPSVSRRSFLKWGSAISGTAVASVLMPGGLLKQVLNPDKAKAVDEGTWIYTACNMCGGNTGIKVNVVSGVVKKIEPSEYTASGITNTCSSASDPADFLMARTGWAAGMCPKGNSGVKSLYDPDRIKTPMKRNPASPRGAGAVFAPISWDDALNEIKTNLQNLKAEQGGNGAHQLLFFSEDGITGNNPQQDFMKMYGSPNYLNHSNLCDTGRKMAFKTAFGDDRPLPDFGHAKYAMIWGWNPLGATKWSHLPRIARQFFDNGGRMVVIDPMFSQTAQAACRNGGEWVPIKPGTDGAMALAMAHEIISHNWHDATFVSTYVIGFTEFSNYVMGLGADGIEKTPAWAEGKTGVPAATISRLAQEVSDSANHPAVIDVWSGPGQHTNSTQGGRAITALLALTGQIGQQGNMLYPNRKGPSARAINNSTDTGTGKSLSRKRFDGKGYSKVSGGYPMGHGSGIYVRARDIMLDSDLSSAAYYAKYPYLGADEAEADSNRPKIVFFVMQNFVMSVPNTAKNVAALNKMQYIVAIDTHLSETAQMADIILPGANYLERYDLTVNWVSFWNAALRQPVVVPWVDNPYRTEIGIIMELGRRMGLAGTSGSTLPGDFSMTEEQYLGQQVLLSSPMKTDIYPSGDATVMVDCDAALNAWKALDGTVWPTRTNLEANLGTRGTLFKTSALKTVTGANQKIVLNSYSGTDAGAGGADAITGYTSLQTAGYDALPLYSDPEDAPPNTPGYPLYLVNYKQSEHTHSRSQNNAWLMEMMGTNPCYINSVTATGLGIKDGDAIKVESLYATVNATAFVTEGIQPDTVGMLHGFGHTELGEIAKGKGSADGALSPGKAEAISGQAIHKEVAVKVYKA